MATQSSPVIPGSQFGVGSMVDLTVDSEFFRLDGKPGNIAIQACEAEPSDLGLPPGTTLPVVAIQIDGRDEKENFRIFTGDGGLKRDVSNGGLQLVMRGEAFEAFVNGLIQLRLEVRAHLFTRDRADRARSSIGVDPSPSFARAARDDR